MPWKTIKKERTQVLLLGGSIFDDGIGSMRISNQRRRGKQRSLTKADIHREENLWIEDFRLFAEYFQRLNITIWRCLPTRLYSTREEVVNTIQEFFQIDSNYDAEHLIIFWSGHGSILTGDWSFSHGDDLTCQQLINYWRSSPVFNNDRNHRNSLTIISDTCYAGAWIPILLEENLPRLSYQAACSADEQAYIVNDGNRPRSLLMRKFLLEEKFSIDWYPWFCSNQHPLYVSDKNEAELGKDFSDGQRRVPVIGGRLFFFTVDRHWTSNRKSVDQSKRNQLKQFKDYGVFIDDH